MGTETPFQTLLHKFHTVEKMGPLRGDGNVLSVYGVSKGKEKVVEKMGPLRGDGNFLENIYKSHRLRVEKMGPLRGDGNFITLFHSFVIPVEKMGPLRGDGNSSRSSTIKTTKIL